MTFVRLFTAITLLCSVHASALESLSDGALSSVTGQADGIRLTSEFSLKTPVSIQYIDDDGINVDEYGHALSPNRRQGNLDISLNARTAPNKPLISDIRIKDVNGKKAIHIESKSAAIELAAQIGINGQSLGVMGQDNVTLDAGDAISAWFYPGGDDGSGVTMDLALPDSLQFDSYFEDEGARMSNTVGFRDYRGGTGGLTLSGLTLDVESDGLRVGLPTITDGTLNILNSRLGSDVIGSFLLRDITSGQGGYLRIKNAKSAGEIGLELDAHLASNTRFNLVYLAGAFDPTDVSDTRELSANVALVDGLDVKGLRVNVDGQRGLVLDFDPSNAQAGVSAHVVADRIRLQSGGAFMSANSSAPVTGLGTVDAQMHLTQRSYLQVKGH